MSNSSTLSSILVLPTSNTTGSTPSNPFPQTHYHCQIGRVTTPWIHPKWFGAADIKLHGALNCITPAIDKDGINLTPEAKNAWLNDSTEVTIESDYIRGMTGYEGTEFVCQVQEWFKPTGSVPVRM